ncbi:glycine--tRNA ligase subunit beta [Campylobacter sp. FMV-PI01]|uniref:Glycine--tRNA ligase beta subunit n=1 Tax=Campylobacter portucalensis TaxID=2608384 RepID=A0A6L5WL31_9BACT|nr:glycine--tRNA ligase subunit beta [Campylobacter portucalensis]MSN97102.1 glycine--tRNA ligase subunit beta [Campylobacter portucalensis]
MKILIEIGLEELPAIPFLKEYKNILPKWYEVLNKFSLNSDFKFEFTPRRLVFFSENFPSYQADKIIELIGAPKQIAIKDGVFTKAALSFAQKCGISENELKFKEISGKEVLYYQKIQKGKNSKDVLNEAIDEFLSALNFGKSMRWGEGLFEFIRPIRSLICVLDDKDININSFGLQSQMAFYPHRNYGYKKIHFNSTDEYFQKLHENGVILECKKRRDIIENEFKNIEKSSNLIIEKDDDLLNEIIAITEFPKPLLGKFDEEFLSLPKEVIITTMKENQRYFPCFKDKNLSNHFVVVSNAITQDNDLIINGNERVLKARLSDAMFFWQSDLKNDFNENSLKNVVYMKELGSIYDKEKRELDIALYLAKIYQKELENECGKDFVKFIEQAVMLSKADLTTQMVCEFGELQGIMGGYYAKERGYNNFVVKSIQEQYLPNNDNLPTSLFSSIINISFKLDTLMSLFSISKEPNGNKDPYALRRAANGLIRVVLDNNINFNIKEILASISKNYSKFDINRLENFIFDRLNVIYDANSSIIAACIKSSDGDLKDLNSSILALNAISKEENFKDKFSTFKRLSNIIKDENIDFVDEKLFENCAEISLHKTFCDIDLNEKDCKIYLNSLFDLKNDIDKFFDEVMINVEDKKIRTNRIAIIGQIYKAFLRVADIKEISF